MGYSIDGDYEGEPYLSVISSMFVFNGDLFVYDLDHTIMSELSAVGGVLGLLAGGKASAIVDPMYRTITHPQKVWRLNRETGVFEEMTGFTELMEGTSNEYLWRTQEYNGELYLGTMDSAVIYNYLTQLGTMSFLNWDSDDWAREKSYVDELISSVAALAKEKIGQSEYYQTLLAALRTVKSYMDKFEQLDLSDLEAVKDFLKNDNYEYMIGMLAGLIGTFCCKNVDAAAVGAALADADKKEADEYVDDYIDEDADGETEGLASAVLGLIARISNAIDFGALEKYVAICDIVKNDVAGFDILKTSDGENWEVVVDDGFGDKYNYGCIRFVVTEDGMYIGTANPFFGAQLWRIDAEPVKPVPTPDYDAKHDFVDVPEGSWYADAVEYCDVRGLMVGTSENTFSPDALVTRAMFVTILSRIACADVSGYVGSSFEDVPEGKWYSKPVQWAYENGYTAGVSATEFAPDAPVTREMIVQFLYTYSQLNDLTLFDNFNTNNLAVYEDADQISAWAYDAMRWAVGNGIISGTTEVTLAPRDYATRAQIAVMVANFVENIVINED